jgi:hypothetical protein
MTAARAEISFELDSPRSRASGLRSGGRAQTVAFWLCCAYVLSQVYMVPVWLIGPSWSVWPSVTDLVVLLMMTWLPFVRMAGTMTPEIVTIKRYLVLLACGAVASYFGLTLNLLDLKTVDAANEKGQYFGLYQVYRLGQFLVVFWFATELDLTAKRRLLLRRTIGLTFWITCASLLANYFGLFETPMLAPQIPRSPGTAGPWAFYSLGLVGSPVGAISFHRAYPAVQLLLLAATYICLIPPGRIWLPSLTLVSLFVGCLVSDSRAGFVAACVFAVIFVASRPRVLVAMTAIGVFAIPIGVYLSDEFSGALSRAVERQSTISTSYEEDGFAGRVEIWNDRLALLNRHPVFWAAGTGYGSAVETGSNGHMLYLHIALECGLVGLVGFLVLSQRITVFLWRGAEAGRAMCYATIALMVSALTQETFYPVPALGHFCGMYLFCVVVALRHSAASVRHGKLRAL